MTHEERRREEVVKHLGIIHTWAEYAVEHRTLFMDLKHMRCLLDWSKEAIDLIKKQQAELSGKGGLQ